MYNTCMWVTIIGVDFENKKIVWTWYKYCNFGLRQHLVDLESKPNDFHTHLYVNIALQINMLWMKYSHLGDH
jgi:hypothetical protein